MTTASPIRAHWTLPYRERRDEQGNVLSRTPVEFLPGIPARDLTEDEYQALTVEQRSAVRGCGFYDVVTDEQMKPAIKRAEHAEATGVAARPSAVTSRGGIE